MTVGGEWRILLIEDEDVLAEQISRSISRRPVGADGQMAKVEVAKGFRSGIEKLKAVKYDLVILDIRDDTGDSYEPSEREGDEATPADIGISLYEDIRANRSVPIIFYSAVAHLVQDQHRPPFVSVVSKLDDDEEALRNAIKLAVDSRVPALNRALSQYTEEVLRVYTQEFVERHWLDLSQPERQPDLAYLLARRLALSLGDGSGLEAELSSTPGPDPLDGSQHVVHPMRMYVIPPIGEWTTGDLVRGPAHVTHTAAQAGEVQESDAEGASTDEEAAPLDDADVSLTGERYWVLLTPACDLVQGRLKADYVVLVGCELLRDQVEFTRWDEGRGVSSRVKELDALLSNNRRGTGVQSDRFHALPPAWNLPGLVVDFQRVVHVRYEDLALFERLANLDDPYAQSVSARFGRYLGRTGTPDINLALTRDRL